MKKPKHIWAVTISILVVSACSKSFETAGESTFIEPNQQKTESLEERTMAMPNNTFTDTETITTYAEVMKEVLTMAKEGSFRNYVYENAQELSSEGDDYLVYLDDMSKKFGKSGKFAKSISKIASLTSKIQETDKEARPMVFFPKAETIEDNIIANKGSYDVAKNLKEPLAVLKGAYNSDYSAPGYKLDEQNKLVYVRDVTEEYAWNNDVYVIGQAEQVRSFTPPCDFRKGKDCYSGGPSNGGPVITTSNNFRKNGRAEYGGLIQVTSNLNEIEHWFSGKLEFRMIIAGIEGSAGTVIRDIPFPRIKRKYFKNKKWYDYKVFLFNWNLSNLGDYNVEKWIERDGGSNGEFSLNIPGSPFKPATSTTPAQPAFPGTTVKVSWKRDDDDMGTSIVQFSDKLSQKYNLGRMNFKRK